MVSTSLIAFPVIHALAVVDNDMDRTWYFFLVWASKLSLLDE
jgi:hypothetical protein